MLVRRVFAMPKVRRLHGTKIEEQGGLSKDRAVEVMVGYPDPFAPAVKRPEGEPVKDHVYDPFMDR